MAKRPVEEEDEDRSSDPGDGEEDAESSADRESSAPADADADSHSEGASDEERDPDVAEAEGDEADEDALPTQLGTQRYVFAAFFLAALLGAYIVGRSIDGIWQSLVTRDSVVQAVPFLASVPDDSKQTWSMILAGVISLVYTVRTYRQPSVQKWTEEVSGELVKVKWPSRKDVVASTTVVLATSAIAVVYLFLLDRFWGFVTNLIYGMGT